MSERTTDERLAAIPLFRRLSKKQLKELSSLVTPIDVTAGQALINEGETGREFFVVLAGEAEVSRGGEVIATRGPGTFFGEFSLLLHLPRTATVVATTDMTLEVIERGDFRRLLESSPELYSPLLDAIAQQLADVYESAARRA